MGLAAVYVSRPTWPLFLAGLSVAALGEAVRVWAAGHLEKNQTVSVTGPYAWTRNPLYLGSLFVGLGFALAAGRLELAAIFLVVFATVYIPVMKREAAQLAEKYPDAYAAYASAVPLFWPARPVSQQEGAFSWTRVVRNGEHWTLMGWALVAAIFGGKLLLESGLLVG